MSMLESNPSTESEFQRGVDVIDSLLEPGTASNDALTAKQRTGLHRLKMSLLKSSDMLETRQAHIPKSLLEGIEGVETNDTSLYLVSEFGGFSRAKARWATLRTAVKANSIIRSLKRLTSIDRPMTKQVPVSYAPPEWYNLDRATQLKLADQLSWENLMKWGIDIFQVDKLTNGNPLLFVGWAILASPYSQDAMIKTLRDANQNGGGSDTDIKNMQGYHFIDKYEISQVCMVDFLRATESNYEKENPYHNSIHASDVLQTTHALLTGMNGKRFATSDLELFSVLVGAAIHDVGHPGTNNNFQTNTYSETALIYNDNHVLENYHVSLAFRQILGKDGNPTLNIFKKMRQNDFMKCKKLITEVVLGTDMTQHFQKLNIVKNLPMEDEWEDDEIESVSWELLLFLMHIADISNCAKPYPNSLQWSDRVLDEFFQQGDEERKLGLPISPLCDRETTCKAASQKGFIDYIIRPSFEVLEKYVPEIGNVVMPVINENSSFWDKELEKKKLIEVEDLGHVNDVERSAVKNGKGGEVLQSSTMQESLQSMRIEEEEEYKYEVEDSEEEGSDSKTTEDSANSLSAAAKEKFKQVDEVEISIAVSEKIQQDEKVEAPEENDSEGAQRPILRRIRQKRLRRSSAESDSGDPWQRGRLKPI